MIEDADPMDERPVTSDRAPEAVGAFPHARRVGDLLFVLARFANMVANQDDVPWQGEV